MDQVVSLLPKKPSDLKVAFVPIAADPYDESPWMDMDREKLREFGFKTFDLDLKNKSENHVRDSLKNADVVFVGGGNTFYLLQKMRESDADRAIKDFVDNSGIYIGVSAGSVVAGPDISLVKDFDNPDAAQLDSSKGLRLVDFAVLPHYGKDKYGQLHDQVMKQYGQKYEIVPVTDEQFVYVSDNKSQIIGYRAGGRTEMTKEGLSCSARNDVIGVV